MANRITKEQAAAFRQRWQLVEEAEHQELQTSPLELRFRQLAAMFESARGLGWATTEESEILQVRERWAKLRRSPAAQGAFSPRLYLSAQSDASRACQSCAQGQRAGCEGG